MYSVLKPKVTNTAVATVKEVLASTALPYIQFTGMLLSGVGVVAEGTPIAIQTSTGKIVKYNQAGSGGAEVCKGFLRGPADSTSEDVPCEYIAAGAVKYSLVSAKANWNAGILTDLKARYDSIGDALLFF